MKSSTVCSSWIEFFHERFPVHLALPVIVLFVLANEAVAVWAMEGYFNTGRTLIAFLMCLSFFYRLVIFTDMREGLSPLVTYRQAVIMAFSLIAFELFLTFLVGVYSFIAHLFPIGWSLLIWREFFCRDWLRRHPALYIMIRSPVLALVGYSVGVTTLEISLFDFNAYFYSFGLANLALFNLVSFAMLSTRLFR